MSSTRSGPGKATECVVVAVDYAPPWPEASRPPHGMALAAGALLDAGLTGELARIGLGVRRLVRVGASSDDPKVALPAVAGRVASEVEDALRAGYLPIMIGECSSSAGVAAGLSRACGGDVALVWCDAHADLNTPETSPSGYYGGMPLATIIGRGAPWWRDGAGGGLPLPEGRVALVGARGWDLDPGERAILADAKVAYYPPQAFRDPASKTEVLAGLREMMNAFGPPSTETQAKPRRGLYFHVDVDVLDPAVLPSVYFPSSGGLALTDLYDLARACRTSGPAALAVASLDPSVAPAGSRSVSGDPWPATVGAWAARVARNLVTD